MSVRIETIKGGIAFHVKAVPGASRDQIAGPLGDAIKIRVSAPPEGGRANRAICEMLADTLGVSRSAVSILSGHGKPRKRIAVHGLDVGGAAEKLGLR